ncbi:transposable element Tcb2 transposase [Trichonephila clavipes]|nr:transposable element Tcb2 transposase [Trichonephila clavipes]
MNITRMDWPAYSPDLNPKGHVWDMLGRRIGARQPPPTFLPKLRRTLLEEWCNIPQDQIDNLILSMSRRYKSSNNASTMSLVSRRVPGSNPASRGDTSVFDSSLLRKEFQGFDCARECVPQKIDGRISCH